MRDSFRKPEQALRYLADHSLDFGFFGDAHKQELTVYLKGYVHGAPWKKLLVIPYENLYDFIQHQHQYMQRLLHEHVKARQSTAFESHEVGEVRVSAFEMASESNIQAEPWVSNLG